MSESEQDKVQAEISPSSNRLAGVPMSARAATVAILIILALVFLVYFRTLWFDFVHDDRPQIVGNTWLRAWKYLPRYFTADVWSFLHPVFRGTFYRPMFLLWLRLQYLVFGLRPWGWHLCTILCHVGVTLLAYCTAERLLEDRLAALFTALIFGLHPTHAEAVAWVSGVTEPLFALFLFASYLCYLQKRAEPARARRYWAASLILYAFACLSKETAVILPIIIFACELVWSEPVGSSRWRDWTRRCLDAGKVVAPYLALFVIYIAARLFSLQGFQNTKEAHSYLAMFLTWPSVLWFYIQHLFWPRDLSPFYSMEFFNRVDVRNVLLPAVPVAVAAIGLGYLARRSAKAAVATIWLVVPILPVLNLRAFIEGHLVHDRYLYLPSFGFAMLVALGIRQFLPRQGRVWGQPAIQIGLACALGVLLGVASLQAMACYANDTTFFAFITNSGPEGRKPNMNLAGILGQRGQLDEALRMYEQLSLTEPDSWDISYNLGYAYYLKGRLPEADRYLSRAVQIDASRPDGFFYLGLTKLKLGDIDAAAANVQRAVIIRPDAEHYHFALGVIFRLQGNLPGALSEFRQEIDLDPRNDSARRQAKEIEAALSGTHKGGVAGPTPDLSSR